MVKGLKIATAIMAGLIVVFLTITIVRTVKERKESSSNTPETSFVFGQGVNTPEESISESLTAEN